MSGLPDGFYIREIELQDYEGVKLTLKNLTVVEPLTKQSFENVVTFWKTQLVRNTIKTYNVYVIVHLDNEGREDGIAAVGTLFLEQKLIHGGGLVGHIEDISVSENYQGKSLGKHLIAHLSNVGRDAGCYKVILDCAEKNIGFYEKCGYKRAAIEMDKRF
ncbi:glucosamine 6-phosphate N-acetyltransferase KNAG_0E03390 [Huiozyma naganishii CBS 8797]|uniref:Glucosamine 6-phosphate N-acetyltransferase n=1 Tax=Huiozyma naganishii (strain ATCC MYA-139 / BCRC 22969 / CBS 8797 / KCTC 17520 / NBRC 10181 / NCYC 3082 / Yp74L-3) TaxID=1071383 RepID=J7RZG2_HUIN7|nr:hypothetical protein KNAG_0E03390 [Kazachstania naganishii CBS 8797]CCK70597.1 hypothetical protein KNAG_0E03390 [Kazachstania naganishii CBS 8797]